MAVDRAGGIGLRNKLPWRIPADMQHFKRITTTTRDPQKVNAVLMGRETYQSIGKPLHDRYNYVLTRDTELLAHKPVWLGTDTRLEFTEWPLFSSRVETVFVIGGSSVYNRFVNMCERAHVTLVLGTFGCDRFFTLPTHFVPTCRDTKTHVQHEYVFQFRTYVRQTPPWVVDHYATFGDMADKADDVGNIRVPDLHLPGQLAPGPC